MQSFWFIRDASVEIEAIAMGFWYMALGDIPEAAIEQAINERMRSANDKRPKPGEIRERALMRVEKPARALNPGEKPFGPYLVTEGEAG